MKKYILLFILSIVLLGFICYLVFFNNKTSPSPANAERMSTEIENSSNSNIVNNSDTTTTTNTTNTQTKVVPATHNAKEKIAEFSTTIYVDDDNRDLNMKLTASQINGTIIKNGDTFSFNEIAGNPTPDRGYKEAGVFINGKKKKGYGGGNCQVSTTIYNAALKVENIEIIERHEHKRDVGYVEKGKDSTVVYDELDLKFKNNTGSDIEIYVEVTEEKVTAKINKITL